jgi:hypothetical protein
MPLDSLRRGQIVWVLLCGLTAHWHHHFDKVADTDDTPRQTRLWFWPGDSEFPFQLKESFGVFLMSSGYSPFLVWQAWFSSKVSLQCWSDEWSSDVTFHHFLWELPANCNQEMWQDLHDDDKTCMQSSYWELILENGQWLGCWITDGLCALPVTCWTGIHGFGYLSPLIRIASLSAHKLIRQDTAVLHQAIIV